MPYALEHFKDKNWVILRPEFPFPIQSLAHCKHLIVGIGRAETFAK
jgi:hypothetical protein